MMAASDPNFRSASIAARWIGLLILTLAGCTAGGGGELADNGGVSGTGLSQGAISSFGSIFVNGVEWDLSGATIELDGAPATEDDLRVGMVVRVEGDFSAGNTTGIAQRVIYDDEVEGPIESAPVETVPGVEKRFSILGQSVTVNALTTVFDDGAAYATLAADDVLAVTGFVDSTGAIAATRVQRKSPFPGNAEVELRGAVATLSAQPDDTGDFMLGTILVHYDATTVFEDTTRASLADGDRVEVKGTLRASGNEIDATRVEAEDDALGASDLARIEVEGFVENCAASADYCVGNVPIDDSAATFEPAGFVPAPGDRVEIKGALEAGVLRADLVASEDEDELEQNVRVEAAVTSVDGAARSLVILGVTITADGNTLIKDESAVGDTRFEFGEILPGDFLEIRAIQEEAGGSVRAISIERRDATVGVDDVSLRGPVSALDPDPSPPDMSILGQPIPLDGATLYFDATETPRTEEQFFRNPGDVVLGDVVGVKDRSAASLSALSEADEVELEGL